MNVLPFVIAILLILSYAMTASFQGRLSTHRNQKAYVALRGAEKRILRHSEKAQFDGMSGAKLEKEKKKRDSAEKRKKEPEHLKFPPNPVSARLNLYPLIFEGRNEKSALYETTAKLLRIFYQKELFEKEKRFEYRFLDSLLAGAKKAVKENISLPLETITMKDPDLQTFYYLFLKGTKRYQLSQKGYPPLVDYLKIEKSPSKISLFHCHPDMLTVFFGSKIAKKLYIELHGEEKKSMMNLEAIIQWAADPQLGLIDVAVWDLIDFKQSKQAASSRQTFVAEEDGILIRKNLTVKSGVRS